MPFNHSNLQADDDEVPFVVGWYVDAEGGQHWTSEVEANRHGWTPTDLLSGPAEEPPAEAEQPGPRAKTRK